jgi:hypothetical protein
MSSLNRNVIYIPQILRYILRYAIGAGSNV